MKSSAHILSTLFLATALTLGACARSETTKTSAPAVEEGNTGTVGSTTQPSTGAPQNAAGNQPTQNGNPAPSGPEVGTHLSPSSSPSSSPAPMPAGTATSTPSAAMPSEGPVGTPRGGGSAPQTGGALPSETGSASGTTGSENSDVPAKVMAALRAEKGYEGISAMMSPEGCVMLSGMVSSARAKDMAGAIAMSVPGVRCVVNRITDQ